MAIPVEAFIRSSGTTFYVYHESKLTEAVIDLEKKLPNLSRKNNGEPPGM